MEGNDSSIISRIQYPYAVDENGALVFIENVDKESRHNHSFVCPNCGKPMVPRLGEHNAHCFAHDKGKACGKESYIHKAAKEILAKRFNESDTFPVTFYTRCECKQAQSCEHFDLCRCGYKEKKEYDLKESYDLHAEVEYTIVNDDIEFRPDVALLSSNKLRKPIFLEVFFKHKSTEEKISHNQCIEFRVKDFCDLHNLESAPIIESETIKFLNFKKRPVTPEQIDEYIRKQPEIMDFRSCDCVLPFCKQSMEYKRRESPIQRFILYKSGKSFNMGIFENELNTHKPSAVADVTYYLKSGVRNFIPEYALAKKDQRFLICTLCEHCINWEGEVTWCKLVKNGSSRKGTFNPKKASYCKFFEWASWLTQFPGNNTMLEDNLEGRDYFIWIANEI